jgi:hypothetical protein
MVSEEDAMHPMFAELFMKPDEDLEAGTGVGFAGRGGLVSSGLFPRPAVRPVGPGAPRPREGQRDHP